MGEAYRELKFIVKVRVVENSVKSHVGKVYDTQKRTLGSTLKIDRMTRPSKPNVDVETVCAASGVALAVRRACSALAMVVVDASTRDVTTPDDAMITKVVSEGLNARRSPNAILLRSTVKMQNTDTHVGVLSWHVDVRTTVLGCL